MSYDMIDKQELAMPSWQRSRSTRTAATSRRSDVILKGALAAGAVYGALMVGPFVRKALAMTGAATSTSSTSPSPSSTWSRPSTRKRRTGPKPSGELKKLVDTARRRRETARRSARRRRSSSSGGKPVAEPKFNFEYNDTAGFLKLAQTFEDTGVSAYNGAAPDDQVERSAGAAGSIVQVEARHAAAIRLQNKEEPAPDAFDPPLAEAQVLKAVEPFIA